MEEKKPMSTALQVILGLLIGGSYAIIPILIYKFFMNNFGLILLIVVLIITFIISIKLIKEGVYRPFGITLLTTGIILLMISILCIGVLLLFGACFGMFSN